MRTRPSRQAVAASRPSALRQAALTAKSCRSGNVRNSAVSAFHTSTWPSPYAETTQQESPLNSHAKSLLSLLIPGDTARPVSAFQVRIEEEGLLPCSLRIDETDSTDWAFAV